MPWLPKSGYSKVSGITLFIITLVLLLAGIALFLYEKTTELTDHFLKSQGILVELHDGLSNEIIENLNAGFAQLPFVSAIRFISREEAARKLAEDLGDDFVGFLGFNPLPDAFEIYLKRDYFLADSLNKIKQVLAGNIHVKSVYFRENLLFQLISNLQKIIWYITLIGGLLLVISVLLIYNTVRLAIHNHRLLIKSMLLVGATENYIRKPFIRTGMMQGIVSGFLASLILWVLLSLLQQYTALDLLQLNPGPFLGICLANILLGLTVCSLSYLLAVKKYLRHNLEELY